MYSQDSFRPLTSIDSQQRTVFSVWGLNTQKSPYLSSIWANVLLSENYSGSQGFPGSAKLTGVSEAAKDEV